MHKAGQKLLALTAGVGAALQSRLTAQPQKGRGQDMEGPDIIIRHGLIIMVGLFASLLLWATFCHISGAIVAPGKIKIESERKTVQHLEGGIVESILVREGQEVVAGQTLLTLESVQTDASESLVQKQLVALLAMQTRLLVEKELGSVLQWPDSVLSMARAVDSMDILRTEEKLLQARHEALTGQISLLTSQRAQVEAQIRGYEEQVKATRTIIGTLQEELKAKRQLYKERYLDQSQIFELERTKATHEGNLGRLVQSVAQTKQRIGEIDLHMADTKNRFLEGVAGELGKAENEIEQFRERVRPMMDAKERLQITAPVAGRVVDIKVHSRGGVVRSGEVLMDIVPHDTPLIVDVHVPVNKVTEIFPGQEALVQMDAFDTRIVPHMPAKVTYISADRLEERTPQGMVPYYLCYVQIDSKALESAMLYLAPGMPVTVYITTTPRTVMYHMFEPLIKKWDSALRD